MDPPMFIGADRDGKRVTLPKKLCKRLAEGEVPVACGVSFYQYR
jgi:hypothetical protein